MTNMKKYRFLLALFFVSAVNSFAQTAEGQKKAENEGDANALFNSGMSFYQKQDYAEAVKWYQKSAEQGHAKAQFRLGGCYYYGLGVKKNVVEAVKWYRKSAEQENAKAQSSLGFCYYHGYGVSRDYAEAAKWYQKSAKQGDAGAQFNLGMCYEKGQGVSKNLSEAKKWYRKSAEQGFADAKKQLAKLGDEPKIPDTNVATIDWLDFSPTTTEQQYALKAGIKSTSKIESWTVSVNGVVERGINPVKGDGYALTIDKMLTLAEGINTIKIEVKNAGGITTEQNYVTYNVAKKETVATIDWLDFSPTTTERQYALKAGIKSASKIESWTVSVNGIVERGINPVKGDGYALTIDKMLTLAEGTNTIKIEVKNAGGVTTTEKNVAYNAIKKAPVIQQKRIALVMGNADYMDSDKKLKNPVNDATDIAAKLENLGFTVIRGLDRTQQEMETAIHNFGTQARNYDVALFYYAGHGIQSNGSNYLVPVDANLPEESFVQYKCTNADLVLDLMEKAHCQMKIVILDACRNNPFARSWNRSTNNSGLKFMSAPKGTFIAFSTAPGDVAQDGKEGERNSPYTTALLQTLDTPNLSITDFFQEVLEKVAIKTNDKQNPWVSGSFRGKFIFNQQ